MHEQGLADHELVHESERDEFEGTSAVPAVGSEDHVDNGGVEPRSTVSASRSEESAPAREPDAD
jgi:hypothetical protein